MKKEFKRKSEIHNLIRKAFNRGMDINDNESVKDFVDNIMDNYDTKPETLAYIVQSVNRYALANEFRKANNKQVYPNINLINVVKFCNSYGYNNIYTVINDALSSKFTSKNMNKTASKATIHDYHTMKKAASRSEDLMKEFNKDEKFKDVVNRENAKLASLLEDMSETYWQIPHVESFIKAAHMDNDKITKEILDVARNTKVDAACKYANSGLNGMGKLMSLINEIKLIKRNIK